MAMNFGSALNLLKGGRRITREGWSGKHMYLYLEEYARSSFEVEYEPVIVMFTAQGRHQPGWLASQADMLSDDWCEVVQEPPLIKET